MYYVKFEGMSEDEARQMIEEAKKENEPEEPDLFGKEQRWYHGSIDNEHFYYLRYNYYLATYELEEVIC